MLGRPVGTHFLWPGSHGLVSSCYAACRFQSGADCPSDIAWGSMLPGYGGSWRVFWSGSDTAGHALASRCGTGFLYHHNTRLWIPKLRIRRGAMVSSIARRTRSGIYLVAGGAYLVVVCPSDTAGSNGLSGCGGPWRLVFGFVPPRLSLLQTPAQWNYYYHVVPSFLLS